MDWDKLRIFHTVARAGSFTDGARKLGMSQSSVSRQVRAIEDHLNVSLFNRHARGLVLTYEGERLFDTAEDMAGRLAQTEQLLLESKGRPGGRLRVTTMISFGAYWLAPRLRAFVERYPEMDVELLLDDADLDLSRREADVAIRFHGSRQSELIQRPLVQVHHHIYAASDYLARMGTPQTAADLDQHNIIAFGPETPDALRDINWTLTIGAGSKPRQPVLKINNTYAVLQAIRSGMGLAAIPDYLAEEQTGLVRVLPEIERPAFETYFVYPQELRGSKRVRLFREFLQEQVNRNADRI